MLKISFLGCTKVELCDLAVCIAVNGKKLKESRRDLDPFLTMLSIETVRAISIYYKFFQFHVPRSISF